MQLDLLILIRLASVKTLSRAEFMEQVGPLRGAGFLADLDGCLKELTADGLIESKPKSLRATEEGRLRALRALKVDKMPRWDVVQRRHLPALGVAIVTIDDLKAVVLAERLLLEFERASRKTRTQRLGELVTVAVEILRMSPRKLRAEQWRLASESATPEPSTKPSPPPRKDWTDAELVAAVHAAAARVPDEGRFGADRVFISALWKQLDEGAAFPGLTLDGFKKRLLDANRHQQLTLARADMPGAMDRATVAASEIRHLNSTFHFVLDRSRL